MVRSAHQSGFTLVETLIALSVFALVALGGVALLDVSIRSQERLANASEETRTLQRLQATLRSDFGQMVERQSRNEAGVFETAASPARGRALLEFARIGRLFDPDAPQPKLQKVRYWVDAGTLYRATFTHTDGAQLPPAVALLDGVLSVQVRLFRNGQWFDLAPGASLVPLPKAVGLTVDHAVYGAIELRYLTTAAGQADTFSQTAVF